jgi:hypothetical protein
MVETVFLEYDIDNLNLNKLINETDDNSIRLRCTA